MEIKVGMKFKTKDHPFSIDKEIEIINIDLPNIRYKYGDGSISYRKIESFNIGINLIPLIPITEEIPPVINSHLYCSCNKPNVMLNSAFGSVFKVCTICKKEKI